MPDDVRDHLVFEAVFPTEGGWIGDEPDQDDPPGRELTGFLMSVVAPEAPLDDIWNEEGYGWSFNSRISGITVNVLVQRLDAWLVIVSEVSLRPRFLRGEAYRRAVESVVETIEMRARADPRFQGFQALTRKEHFALELGGRPRRRGPVPRTPTRR